MVLESRSSREKIQPLLVSLAPAMSMTISFAICSTAEKGHFLSPGICFRFFVVPVDLFQAIERGWGQHSGMKTETRMKSLTRTESGTGTGTRDASLASPPL
ncbi:hypothetical protein TIFTF001_015263 [Ficus carica]|uniref:Uncharacterized protein n=1 Tax=Ficus carica TaxID=3494 RepID=A0AA88A0W4_FICCA|nr:hypothetical protein TIFTF001_015263 [Ficus carica]